MSDTPKNDASTANRREFLKRLAIDSALAAGAVGVGFGLASGGPSVPQETDDRADATPRRDAVPEPSGPSVLAIAKGDDAAANTRRVVDALGGMQKFISRGDRVVLKPNIGWDRRPKHAANTNPDAVAETARMCLEAGAREVIVTDSPCNLPTRCFDKSGIKKAVADLDDVRILIPTERDYVDTDLGGEVLGEWPVLRAILDADKVINLPIAKHHSSAILTLGMKNWYGILGGGKLRGRLHQEMALSIAELADFMRPALTILDAYRILLRNGPQGGSFKDVEKRDTALASTDPVAIDTYAAGFFDMTPEQVPFIPAAVALGLGTSDLSSVETIMAN